MSLSKNKIKYIHSLKDKKNRREQGVFVAEGKKLVADLLSSCQCQLIAALPESVHDFKAANAEIITATEEELKKASSLKTTSSVIGVFFQPEIQQPEEINLKDRLSLVLDGIQDPGNMGTIVRIADWFGIENIICSHDTADIYNPKTVQATMGAIARIHVHYSDLSSFLEENKQLPIYGTFLEGENIYTEDLSQNGLIVMGNEGNGIRPETEKHINKKLFIPNYPIGSETSESLNVAVATAIICSEFRRRQ